MSAPDTARERFLKLWASAHAFGMIASTVLVAGWRAPWLLAVSSAASFAVLVAGSRRWWTPGGGFGLPNGVTSVRLIATLSALGFHAACPSALLAGVAFAVLVLDGIDGWLARRHGHASAFGARYDVEVDATLTLALPVLLWVRGIAGPWVLIAGAWRYVYVAAPLIFPPAAGEARRSRFGRSIYALTITAFVLAFVLPPWAGAVAAAVGTIAVSASFATSFFQRYRPTPAA